jgi:hypothetical protein
LRQFPATGTAGIKTEEGIGDRGEKVTSASASGKFCSGGGRCGLRGRDVYALSETCEEVRFWNVLAFAGLSWGWLDPGREFGDILLGKLKIECVGEIERSNENYRVLAHAQLTGRGSLLVIATEQSEEAAGTDQRYLRRPATGSFFQSHEIPDDEMSRIALRVRKFGRCKADSNKEVKGGNRLHHVGFTAQKRNGPE